MHQPRPHGTFGTDSEEDAAALEMLARRLTNLKDLSGLSSMRLTRTLPSGAMAVATDAGGIFKVIVRPQQDAASIEEKFSGVATSAIPMMFSGVIKHAVLWGSEGVQMEITTTCQKRLVGYSSSDKKKPPAKLQTLQRFAIEYNGIHQELLPPPPREQKYTQYHRLRPTWFSGAMASVVQAVGGYGRLELKKLPKSAVERAEMILPASVIAQVRAQMGNVALPGYTGGPPKSGQIQYDYKFHSTNAVGFDDKGKPWLLRIRPDGVHAMPLPMIPATTTPAFREYIEEVGDGEILWLLNKFGGMPSGEGFPAVGPFEAWLRAGVIIKICDSGGFYQNLAYSTACGWSFNDSGTEGFNTCYGYGGDLIQIGYAYKLTLRLCSAEFDGKLPKEFRPDNEDDARRLDTYMSAIYRCLGSEAKDLAIRYKLRRTPIGDILARARFTTDTVSDAEMDYWDKLKLPPIAAHSGGITCTGRGSLWAPGKPKFHPQIKFPEPFLDGCVSHDFSPYEYVSLSPGWVVLCDTIMFGYYVGNDLKVVKYFYDARKYNAQSPVDEDECMIVGSWEHTSTVGETSINGHFYTSDIDEREASAPSTTVTKTVGTGLGYDTKPRFRFDYMFCTSGTMWRNRYFQHRTNSEKRDGYSKTLAVCIPFLERSAVIHARREYTSGKTKISSLGLYAMRDPNSYRYKTYDFIWAWMGTSATGNAGHAEKVAPPPINGNPVWVLGYNYNPGQCTDFADGGDWVGGLPADYTWLIHPVRHEWQHSGGGGAPTVQEYTLTKSEDSKTEGGSVISLMPSVQKLGDELVEEYFTISPVEGGVAFYVDATRNSGGDSEYANCSGEDPTSGGRKYWGHTSLADHKTAHHFIGVINE